MKRGLEIYLVRHGATEWSEKGKHTGLTDLELTDAGIRQAKALAKRLSGISFAHVLSSPLRRAYHTCEICGLEPYAALTDELLEWDYGDYEGMTSKQIWKQIPDWNIFTHGAKNGESVEDVAKRANTLLSKLQTFKGKVILFSSGHISKALACSWIEKNLELGRHLLLSTASLSILSYEHGIPILSSWNDTNHLYLP